MNAAKVTLTGDERSEIRTAIANGYYDHTAEDKVSVAVESIIAAKVAEDRERIRTGLLELLRSDHLPDDVEEHPEGCCDICDWVGCLQDEWLAEYEGGDS